MAYCPFENAKVEMHILAYCYHWDRDTIMNLSRSERKMWVDMIHRQKEAENDSISGAKSSTPTSSYAES